MIWRMRSSSQGRQGGWIVGISLCLMVSHAWGQDTPRGQSLTEPPTTATEPGPLPQSAVPPIGAYPLELMGLLAPPAQRGRVTLMPSIAIGEEFNDNIFLDNRNRKWDFITGFGPAIALYVNRPDYQLDAGYSFSAEVYAREARLSNAFDRQNFIGGGLYRVSPTLTLTATDTFAYNRNTNLVVSQGFSTGRQESWSNTFTPGTTWQMTPLNSLSLSASYTALRFPGSGASLDSDTYGFQSAFTHAFTPRFGGSIGYSFTYVDAEAQIPSKTHTLVLGFSYRITPTLTAMISGGPAITEIGGETTVSPAGTASLVQTLSFGRASFQYTRGVGAAGGFGGTTDIQTFSGTLMLTSLQRGLLVSLNPTYSTAKSLNSQQQTGEVDVQTLSVGLAATYQIARYVSLFGGYTFFRQRTSGSTPVQVDVDQNRVRLGLQFGYPINFD